ncbi:TetR family transcriptional regulator [Burkholderia sp. Leaf177]|uniref:TetR/AcrR family transcriptional regulator n=1 Tax=Burkholderia sp. Leaf177 TaxID=1736287 RepID=UPI0006F5445E|nr:TetR/AcrR family transcriptional regulator [Burkholderia sp. Leaf177]KQR73659.1 TetR family transcriptional regulator [Burkholderia sp. Leaf177]
MNERRKPAAVSRSKQTQVSTATSAQKPYHHGSLPNALLAAAETVLRTEGISGLSLRSIAREAGVSHTAPQHHFGDTAGVLSELAAIGHRRLTETMAKHAHGLPPGSQRRRAIARGYVSFAVANADLFRLMSRADMLDNTRPALVEARRASAMALSDVTDDSTDVTQSPKLDAARAVAMTAAWAYVHGLATLLIDGRLNGLALAADGVENADALVDATIEQMQIQ